MTIAFTILGECASKANSRQIVKIAGKTRSIKSDKALAYVNSVQRQIPPAARQMLDKPVSVTLVMWYASERPDLDESALLDALQATYVRMPKQPGEKVGQRVLTRRGVIVNDRQVREKHVHHRIDRKNPRVDVYVSLIEDTTA